MQHKANYQKQLDELLKTLEGRDSKPTLLLHACCGPCSSYVLEYLSKYFQITVLYYNPNIYPQAEYERRLTELKKLYERFGPVVDYGVKLVEYGYEPEEFYEAIGVKNEPELATEPEKGERCRRCYKLRLDRAFNYAKENHFDYFCTSLSISPFKDAVKINEIGAQLESEDAPKWLVSDFKKKGGFKRSLELSEEYGMYRQTYCGCIYSMNNKNLISSEPSEQ